MDFEQNLKSIKTDIKRFAIRYGAFEKGNEKLLDHLAYAINILDHVALKHNPKSKKEKVVFT